MKRKGLADTAVREIPRGVAPQGRKTTKLKKLREHGEHGSDAREIGSPKLLVPNLVEPLAVLKKSPVVLCVFR